MYSSAIFLCEVPLKQKWIKVLDETNIVKSEG